VVFHTNISYFTTRHASKYFDDFRKINCQIKIFEKCNLASCHATLGALAVVGHGARGDANGRQYWGTALEETLTVASTGQWGQVPAAVTVRGRIPSAVAHGSRILSTVAHDGKALAPCATAAAPTYIRGRAPAAGPSFLPPDLRLSTLRSTCEVRFSI
jgi:hypothetical protein